jgi:uncharacterized protein with PQ loop repeat
MLSLKHARKLRGKAVKRQNKVEKAEHPVLDAATYFAGIASPLMTIPQIYDVWVLNRLDGVSVTSWSGYLLFSFVWLAYGIVHKDRPIIVSSMLWVIAEGLVVLRIVQ